jgi:hypothetical protein
MRWEKFQTAVYAEEGVWLEDEFRWDVRIFREEMYPEIPKLWKATGAASIAFLRRSIS